MAFYAPPILAAALVATVAAPAVAAGLDEYLWKFRPELVFAPSQDAPKAADQLRRLEAAGSDLAERDMPILLVTDGAVVTAIGEPMRGRLDAPALRKRYGVPEGGFAVVLIGKDGGEKLRADEPVSAEKLTALVDTMPMRARESR